MTLEAEGAYIRLLSYNWQDGSIPADVSQLARMCKCSVKKMAILWDEHLRECFKPSMADPDRLVNGRLEEIREGLLEFLESKSKAGRYGGIKSGEIRRSKAEAKRSTPSNLLEANFKQTPSETNLSSLQSSIPPIVPQNGNGTASETGTYSGDFEAFWTNYPKKAGKGDAFKEWKKLKPSQALQELIIAAIARQKRSSDWKRDAGQYIPNPSTWLHQKRWDDELPLAAAAGDIVV